MSAPQCLHRAKRYPWLFLAQNDECLILNTEGSQTLKKKLLSYLRCLQGLHMGFAVGIKLFLKLKENFTEKSKAQSLFYHW